MAKVSSSLEAMDRMVSNINKFISAQQSLMVALGNDYNTIRASWDDEKYQQFGETLGQSITDIKKSSYSLSECVLKLQRLRGKLEEYLSQQV